MVSVARWRAAQRYERGFWERNAAQIAAGAVSQLDWYAWRAKQLAERLRRLGYRELVGGGARSVEIGSGPVGIVAYFPGAVRVAVDPLEHFYRQDPVLTARRPPDVQYTDGVGEHLPCPSGGFDLVIIDNCIDHVRDVTAVMREIARVLRPGGVLYLEVNCRSPWGFLVHRILSRLRIDAGHPHTFTPKRLLALVGKGPLRLRAFEADSASEARRAQLASPDFKSRLKGLLGSSDFATALVAERLGLVAVPGDGDRGAQRSSEEPNPLVPR